MHNMPVARQAVNTNSRSYNTSGGRRPAKPLKIGEFIRLANNFPVNDPLVELADMLQKHGYEVQRGLEAWFGWLEQYKHKADLFYKFCLSEGRDFAGSYFALFRAIRDTLRDLGLWNQQGSSGHVVQLHSPGFDLHALSIDRDGKISIVVTTETSQLYALFLETLKQTNVKRFGVCPLCRRLYYKKRRDQRACPGSCNNRLRQARFQSKVRRVVPGEEKK